MDFRVKLDFFDHPKTVKLRRRLGDGAVISLLRLFAFCAGNRSRCDGSLSGMDHDDIEIAAKWTGEPGALVTELLAVRFLDDGVDGLSIHDWEEHNPWAAGAERRSEAARDAARTRWAKRADAPRMRSASDPHASGMRPAQIRNAPLLSDPSPSPSLSDPISSPARDEMTSTSQLPDPLTTPRHIESAAKLGPMLPRHAADIARVLPVTRTELDAALTDTKSMAAKPNYSYLVSCIQTTRAPPKRRPPRERDVRYGVAQPSTVFQDGDVQL